jgi:DNA integrity scanning protein DisA with diadenylate cyclase activity
VVNGSTPDDAADRYDLAIRREPVFLDRPPHAGRRLPRDASHLMLTLVAEGLVRADDTVVYIYDSTRDGNIDSVRVMRVAAILALPSGFTQSELGSVARLDVLLRVFQLASELSSEGREGKPVGTIFVVGDDEGLENLTQQLILNPFAGHADEDRNLLDPSIGETVKELAKLDGAFLISADGTVRAAGTHLSGRPIRDQMSSGLGARHAAALGISAAAKVIALCISESTRRVSVYWAGRRLTED